MLDTVVLNSGLLASALPSAGTASMVAWVLFFGLAAQWLAWWLKLPSILILLTLGLLVGPSALCLVDTPALLGKAFQPLISMAVAIILFEGGLNLRLADIKGVGKATTRLIVLGLVVTWVLTTVIGLWTLHLPVQLALLVGAILVVTGPTVIMPLMRQVSLKGAVPSMLKWEGIVNDPIGALLALLVFEAIVTQGPTLLVSVLLTSVLMTLLVTVVVGGSLSLLIGHMLRKHWVPHHLESPTVLMLVVVGFVLSNTLQPESGLMVVTAMGIFLANQPGLRVSPMMEFKENLGVLILSSLFILLASRLDWDAFTLLGWQGVWFTVLLLLVVRPVAVWVAMQGMTTVTWQEKLYLSAIAPRGIVAVTIASLFAFKLSEYNVPQVELLEPLFFCVIIGSVLVSSLLATPLAKLLGLCGKNAPGVVIVAAHSWARQLGKHLQDSGIPVCLVDSNTSQIALAKAANLTTLQGNILSEDVRLQLDLATYNHLLALTSNHEVNTLAMHHYKGVLRDERRFQLAAPEGTTLQALAGNPVFTPTTSFNSIRDAMNLGYQLRSLTLADTATLAEALSDTTLSLPTEFEPWLAVTSKAQALLVGAKAIAQADAAQGLGGAVVIGLVKP